MLSMFAFTQPNSGSWLIVLCSGRDFGLAISMFIELIISMMETNGTRDGIFGVSESKNLMEGSA